jgi:hypothetical protein
VVSVFGRDVPVDGYVVYVADRAVPIGSENVLKLFVRFLRSVELFLLSLKPVL